MQKWQTQKMVKTDIPANFIVEVSGLVGVIAVGQRGDRMDDLISRQAAIEQSIVLRDISNPDKEWEVVTVATIKHLKSVQPQKVGRWIPTHHSFESVSDTYFVYQYMCSECKALSYFRRDSEQKIINGAICPNCMAKMEEGK